MKKAPYLLALALLGLTLSACQTVTKKSATTNETTTTQEEKKSEDKQATKTDLPAVADPELVNQGPDYTEESNQLFVQYAIQRSEPDHFLRAETVGNSAIHLYVPDYFLEGDHYHQIGYANAMRGLKDNYFRAWATENGYDLKAVEPPLLVIKAENGTVIAEEIRDNGSQMELVD